MKEQVIRQILSDEAFLPKLSISQQLRLIDRIKKAKSENEVELIISRASKLQPK